MAKSKFSENLIRLRCTVCKRNNYYTLPRFFELIFFFRDFIINWN